MRTLLSLVALLVAVTTNFAADAGVLPVGADGKPLNLDFETGTLKDWTADGDAFKDQPIKGDTVFPRRAPQKSNHQGEYWIGGYEKHLHDKAKGTLTSATFKVTHPWASFLVGGGSYQTTCVELVRKDTGKVFFTTSGRELETLARVAVDLKDVADKEIFIRLVDKHSGGWGHVNFDDFRFHQEKPQIAPLAKPKTVAKLPPTDIFKNAGLKPEEAAKAMTVPPGFEVKLFAGEPDVQQPIAMCIDDRGRLWIAEAYSYPIRQPEGKGKDRILIFEDTDGDGKFDKRTVFTEGLNLVSGLEVGFGGVWVGAAPYLMFIPDKDGDDKPDGEPKILLDGWAYQDTHETLNTFTWGPDGWLYGCHGVFTYSNVGKPGDPDEKRERINAGIWRYHPTKHIFEIFAHGTSNPWGLDFNQYGHAFIEACVIPHNWYIIQGARYHRQSGSHFNPHTYADIQTIAEHRHYVGATPHGGNGRSDEVGGGHAHCGTMIYQGGTWPKEYWGKMFMGNIHGHRINIDTLTPKGSGYTATRHPDFLLTNDRWSMLINLMYGPDGNVYFIDWYDKQSCHHRDPNIWDRGNGRIYKIVHKDAKPVNGVDLKKCKDAELVQYQWHENDWYARHARRILQERYPNGAWKDGEKPTKELLEWYGDLIQRSISEVDERVRLRLLWTLFVLDALGDESYVTRMMKDPSAIIRSWCVRLGIEKAPGSEKLKKAILFLAEKDDSAVVRCAIASALQRMPALDRPSITATLIAHANDQNDHNLPLLYWYVVESLAALNPELTVEMVADEGKIPILHQFVARRAADAATPEALNAIVAALAKSEDDGLRLRMLQGSNEGLKGRRSVTMPEKWPALYAKLLASSNAEVKSQATSLAITFGDAKALSGMRATLADPKTDVAIRQNALTALLGVRDKDLPPVLLKLLGEASMRGASIKGLAVYDELKAPAAILAIYSSLNSEEKRDALNTLVSRATFANELLSAVEKKIVPPSDVSADIVRTMLNLNDAAIEKQIGAVWGIAKRSAAERVQLIADTKKKLLAKKQAAPDLMLGRAMFQKTCAQCHTLYGVGGKISPDLTGSNRANLDYLLENVLDPSSVIPKDYAVTVFEMDSGRKVTGIIKQETPVAVTVQTANEVLILPKKEIEARRSSDVSMMPDDILKTLKEEEFRSLIAYLQHDRQVPILATQDNAKDFFNGKDLTGWIGDPKLWKVENGEIVGTSPGLKRNEFLKSDLAAGDFKLSLKIKLAPNAGNSGIQFRSEVQSDGLVKGYQADAGIGWWGKLYEEHGRALLWDKSGEQHVKKDDWNDYVVIAKGSKIQTFINGQLCVDLDDPMGGKRGIFAFQLHSGNIPFEVRLKELKLELDPK